MPRVKETRKNSAGREVLEWVISLAVAVGLALAVHAWVGQLVTVEGPSMNPGLWSNERVLVGRVEYYFRQPRLGDIVLTRFPNSSEHYIKRVIGVAGDHIAVTDGVLYLNGQPVQEPYLLDALMDMDFEELTVPEDSVFVMGDNRNNSEDSRIVGPLPLSNIEGRAYTVVWPLSKWKQITAYDGRVGA